MCNPVFTGQRFLSFLAVVGLILLKIANCSKELFFGLRNLIVEDAILKNEIRSSKTVNTKHTDI